MAYCTDADLEEYRSDIMDLGIDSWETQREEASRIITRVITARWYNKVAPSLGVDPLMTPFDPDKVQGDDLKRLACYKTFELAYALITKNSQEADGFDRLRQTYKVEYGEELDSILGIGLTYDWDGNDEVDIQEIRIQAPRRLSRC